MFGTVKTVIVCSPGSGEQTICPAGTVPSVTSAYLIEPSAQAQFDAAFAPVDYAQASGYWAIAFAMVVGCWSSAYFFSIVRRAIR